MDVVEAKCAPVYAVLRTTVPTVPIANRYIPYARQRGIYIYRFSHRLTTVDLGPQRARIDTRRDGCRAPPPQRVADPQQRHSSNPASGSKLQDSLQPVSASLENLTLLRRLRCGCRRPVFQPQLRAKEHANTHASRRSYFIPAYIITGFIRLRIR